MSQQIFSHALDNGLVLVGEPSDSFESAAFNFLIPAGCAIEPFTAEGLATMTCEMLLRGAGDRDSRAIVNDLENLGVDRGESVGVTQAVYSGTTVAENLAPALDIFADILRRPSFPKDQLESARQVCLQELRGVEDEPAQKLMLELRRQHYPAPWGRSSHGSKVCLERMSLGDIRKFYRSAYGPEDAILAVAGRFDWDELCGHVESLFGDWKSEGKRPPVDTSSTPRLHHVQYDSNQCHIGIAFPATPYRHPDYFQAWAAVGVLSGGMSSRLFTEVRERRGLCYTVYASLQTQRERAGVFCYAGTTVERAQETLDVTYEELVKLGDGVRQEELDRLKARIKSSLIMQQESTASRSGALARDWRHLGRARSLDEISEIVDGITADSINKYLQENPPGEFTFVTLGPEPLETPGGV